MACRAVSLDFVATKQDRIVVKFHRANLPRLDRDGGRLKVAHDEESSGRVGQNLRGLLHDDEGAHRPEINSS